MTGFHSVVTEQKIFICAVCSFIGKLIRAVLPDIAWDSTFLQSEDALSASLDDVIHRQILEGSNEGDCCLAMVQTACRKMNRICDLLKVACSSVGLEDIAGRYLDAPWFVSLLLRKDAAKLDRLHRTIDFTDRKPSRILMNGAAILEGRTGGYDAMDAQAKRKADRETKALMRQIRADAESLRGKMDVHGKEAKEQLAAVRSELHETKKELLAKADEILRKLGKVNLGGRRNSRHTEAQKKVCLACWMSAQNNTELKDGTARGIATYKAAFNWYRSQLALVGVADFRKFLDVLNAIKTKRSADQKAALEAKLEAKRKKKSSVVNSARDPQPATLNAQRRNVVK